MNRRQALSGLAVLGLTASELKVLGLEKPAAAPSGRWRGRQAEASDLSWPQVVTGISQAYPTTDLIVARDLVGAAHNNLDKVKELVARHPQLAKVSWDWGFGDWETALGAASHVGNRPIAEYLLEQGAPPTIFSSATLGHIDVVKAMVAAQPGLHRVRGPHGISLIAHARAGGAQAAPVVAYLESLPGANDPIPTQPLSAEQRAELAGRYVFGRGPRDVFVIDEVREIVGITRAGASRRNLLHRGELTFTPVGAESVQIRLIRAGDRVDGLTVADPDVVVRATRARG
jgi:hypothetical protein